VIASYRGMGPDGEIWFARYGRVVEPGRVRVGDEVARLP
jgi:MOSC domain-containing protein YiiM